MTVDGEASSLRDTSLFPVGRAGLLHQRLDVVGGLRHVARHQLEPVGVTIASSSIRMPMFQ